MAFWPLGRNRLPFDLKRQLAIPLRDVHHPTLLR